MSVTNLNPKQVKFLSLVNNVWLFKSFMFFKLPMGLISGLKVKSINEDEVTVQVKYKWVNTNPFKSLYFAVLSMAAEMSTGLLSLLYVQDDFAMSILVVKMEAEFFKKAVGKISFKCKDGNLIREAVGRAKESGEGVTFETNSVGYDESNSIVAQFKITWSVKKKSAG